MIKTEQEFIQRLISIADNFKWEIIGNNICGLRDEEKIGETVYDPLSAYIRITKGTIIPRHHTNDMRSSGVISYALFPQIADALYNPSSIHVSFRDKIKNAVGIK